MVFGSQMLASLLLPAAYLLAGNLILSLACFSLAAVHVDRSR